MSSLAEVQRALDLYGQAAYWRERLAYGCGGGAELPDAVAVAQGLREAAERLGVCGEQLADADSYARQCVLRGRRPSGVLASYRDFAAMVGAPVGAAEGGAVPAQYRDAVAEVLRVLRLIRDGQRPAPGDAAVVRAAERRGHVVRDRVGKKFVLTASGRELADSGL